MSQDIPVHVADVLFRFSNVVEHGDGWLAKCPCAYHSGGEGDRNPSLRVAIGETGNVLVLCRTGCKTDDVISSVGLEWKDLLPAAGEYVYHKYARKVITLDEPTSIRRDRAYQLILNELELEEAHREELKSRGLTNSNIQEYQYKSIRTHTFLEACTKLRTNFIPEDYVGDIPGLREAGRNTLYSGLMIPVRDKQSRIIALKIRRFSGDPKYVYLSDTEAPCGAHPHWPKADDHAVTGWNPIRITEGELKADICSALTNIYTVSVPGVTNWKPLVDKLKAQPLRFEEDQYILTFDWPDVVNKPGIRDQVRECIKELSTLGKVGIEHWPLLEYKGLDDLLNAGHSPDTALGIDECLSLLDSLDTPEPTLTAVCVSVPLAVLPGTSDPCEFPLDVYPEKVRDFCALVADGTDAPIDFPGLAALVVAGSAIGSTRRVRITPGWMEAPCYYSAVIAPPGSAKSPAVSRVQRPIIRKQDEFFSKYSREMDAWVKAGDKTAPKPVLTELYTTEATVAAVTDRLVNNPRGILIATDEILSWVKGFNAFHQGNDQQFYLTVWNGQAVKVDRKTGDRPVSFIRNPYVSVLGSIQPKKLCELTGEGRGDDGFLDRFLFSYPNVGDLPYWDPTDYDSGPVDDALSLAWYGVVDRMYGLDLDRGFSRIVQLGKSGWEMACDWYNRRIVDETRDPIFPEYLRGFWLKLRAYYFRFALTLEHLDWASTVGDPPKDISLKSLASAERLCEYFKCHARRVAGHAVPSEEVQQTEELVRWAWSGKKSGLVTARDIVRSNNPILPRKMADARSLLVIAQQYNLGTFHSEKDGIKDVFEAKIRDK